MTTSQIGIYEKDEAYELEREKPRYRSEHIPSTLYHCSGYNGAMLERE